MAKYIIELPDYVNHVSGCQYENGEIMKETHFPVSCLISYPEPDRKAIEDEVWGFAWEVFQLDLPVFREIFGYDTDKMDYREYKSKYEAWLKKKDKICVGDEVIPLDTQYDTMVVTKLWVSEYGDEWVDTIAGDGKMYSFFKTSINKTGRHFPEVEELLKKMGEESE